MIPEYERSKVATLSATFSYGGLPVDPTGLQVTVYYQDEIKVAAATPIKVSTGHYYKTISISADWDLDYYAVIWTGTINGITFKKSEQFKVIDEVTETDVSVPSDTYCTTADVLQELVGINYSIISDYINYLVTRIIQIDARIHNLCHRRFKSDTTAEYLDGNGRNEIQLPNYPISEVSQVSIRPNPNVDWWSATRITYINCHDIHGNPTRAESSDSAVKISDLIVDSGAGIIMLPDQVMYAENQGFPFWNYTFLQGTNNIRVAYTFGYNSVNMPDDIRLLAAKLVAKEFLQVYGDKLSGGGSSVSVEGFGRSYPGIPFAGRLQMLQKDIDEISSNYRQIGIN